MLYNGKKDVMFVLINYVYNDVSVVYVCCHIYVTNIEINIMEIIY